MILEDYGNNDLHDTIRDFVARVAAEDTVFVYLSGHGAEEGGDNFFLPRDYPADGADLPRHALNLQRHVLGPLAAKGTRLNFIALDACRVNADGTPRPPGGGGRAGGLRAIQAPL